MTLQRKHTTPWPWANRPRDYMRDTIELRFEEYDFGGGPLPRRIWVRDPDHRSCWYRAKDMTILEPVTKRMCLRYTTLEHSWDDMPQVLVACDGWGNSCRYEPVDPREGGTYITIDEQLEKEEENDRKRV
jgi:hypothetical protein